MEVWRASKILAPEVLDAYMSHNVLHKDRPAFFRYALGFVCLRAASVQDMSCLCHTAITELADRQGSFIKWAPFKAEPAKLCQAAQLASLIPSQQRIGANC